MAGSYNHIVNEPVGSLRKKPTELLDFGDTDEALAECYGMIWYLANRALRHQQAAMSGYCMATIESIVEEARVNHKEGLAISPTKRYKKGG